MPLEQIKPAFSFYDSHINSSTSKQQTSDLSDQSNSPTSLPYYYQSSLRSNKAGRRYSHNKGRSSYRWDDADEGDSDQEIEVSTEDQQKRRGLHTQNAAEEEDSGESSPPSPLSPPETNNLNHSGDPHGIRSIGGSGNLIRERDQQEEDRHHPAWRSSFQSAFSHTKEDSLEDGNATIHQSREEVAECPDLFQDSNSTATNRHSKSSLNSHNWYTASGSSSREGRGDSEDASALTKLGGVGGVTRSGSWGRDLSSETRQELRSQRDFLEQEAESEKPESEDENRGSRQRRRDSTEGKDSNIRSFGVGTRSIGKRRSIPSPSPPTSPVDSEDTSASKLAYLSTSHPEIATISSARSNINSKFFAPDQTLSSSSGVSSHQIPTYSRTSTNSTSSTRFSHASTNSSYSDSSYSSYASSNPNAAPSALSLRSVSGSIKSTKDKERNRDSSSSLRSNRSAYSQKESPMEEQREDLDAEEGTEKQSSHGRESTNLGRDAGEQGLGHDRSGSDETASTTVGEKKEAQNAVESRRDQSSEVDSQDEPIPVAPATTTTTAAQAKASASLASGSNSGFSSGGFKTVSKGSNSTPDSRTPMTEQQPQVERREGSDSNLYSSGKSFEPSLSDSNPETMPSTSSSSSPFAKKSLQSHRRVMTPLTLASLSSSPSSNTNNHPSVFNSSGSSTSNPQTVGSPTSTSSNTQFQFEPPVPRRHSGIYLARTRSALSSRHPTINSRFEHGHGGRAAARERAALENAKFEGRELKARNMSTSSSVFGTAKAYAASQPASPLILSSSGANFIPDWQGLSAFSPVNPIPRSDLDNQLRTPQASRAALPSPSFSTPPYFHPSSRRDSDSTGASTTPVPAPSSHFSPQTIQSQSHALSPSLSKSATPDSTLSRSLGERKGLRALTVLTSRDSSERESSAREAVFGLGLSPSSTPKGFLEGDGLDPSSPIPSGSNSPVGGRPKMQRASTTGHGMGLKLMGGVGQVLRTPTTEEWTRFLAERGAGFGTSGVDFRQLRLAAACGNGSPSNVSSIVDEPSGSMPRSRSSSLLPSLVTASAVAAASSSTSLPDPSEVIPEHQDEATSGGSVPDSDPDSDSAHNLEIAASMISSSGNSLVANDSSSSSVGVLERLRMISAGALSSIGGKSLGRRTAASSKAGSSVRGSDLQSLNEEDDEDEDEAVDSSSEGEAAQDLDVDGEPHTVGHARHGSSSSLERMNALYEAISRPQSRVTSPAMSPFNSPGRPSSPISNRISLDQDGSGLGSHLTSLSSTSLSLETYAKNSNSGVSPSSSSNLSLGSNSHADLNKTTNNSPSSPNRYQSPLLANANTRRGSSHSQASSSTNPGAGLSASPSFASASGVAISGNSLLPPSNESQLTRETTLRPNAPPSVPSETGHKSSVAIKREAAVASAAERQVAAHAFGYPLPPPGTSRSINEFVVTADIGRGAYGLVKKVRIKGPDGNPIGDEFIIKYIIKSRILADCWRRHRVLGPIPIEIHVMDQLRRLAYEPPATPHPWSPEMLSKESGTPTSYQAPSEASTHLTQSQEGESLNNSASPTSPAHQLHPNICPMVDFFEDHEFYYLIMPVFGRGQDLFDYVESLPDGLSALQVRSIFGQVADALSFLHLNSIVHRDIKDENVILNFKAGSEEDISQAIPTAQLIDFGSATHIRPGRLFDTFSGTLDYAAAEILRGEKYGGREQDVWALGVVGYVLLCGECPFWNGEEAVLGLTPDSRAATSLQERCFPPQLSDEEPSDEISTMRLLADVEGQEDGGGRLCDAADLIARCLELDQDARPTAQQICSHKFLIGSKGWRGPRGWLVDEEGKTQSLGQVLLDGSSGELVRASA